jgi:alpha-N-acetylglucosamine transferase
MPNEIEEQDLKVEMLESGDRPSLFALGLWGAQSIRQSKMAVFMVDVLGRVQLMPVSAVQVIVKPRVDDDTLDTLTVEEAIHVMVAQDDTEQLILDYIKRRKTKEAANGSAGL